MQRTFLHYKVNIIDKEFTVNNTKYPKTAEVILFGKKDEIQEKINYAYADIEHIKKAIEETQKLELDNCYIKDFDTDEIRKIIQADRLIFQNFSAENSFFDNEKNDIDFSNIFFDNELINFENTVFSCKNLSFSGSKFNSDFINFSYVLFNCKKVTFSKTNYYEGDISFKHSIFRNGIKDFQDIQFGNGMVIFENADFGNGDVLFTGTNFNSGKTTFKIANFGTGKVDFSRVKFGKDETSFERVNFGDGDLSFRSANFENGKVNFVNSNFGKGKKSFINTDFGNGNVVFKNSTFTDGKISFRLAVFGEGIVDFHFAEFGKGDINFDNTKFKDGGINFRAVDLGTGKISFKRAFLGHGNITFENCSLAGLFYMQDSVFGNGEFNLQDADFRNADVEINNVDFGIGKVSFQRSKFKILSFKDSQLDNYFDLRIKSCQMLDLSNTVIKDIVDINPHDYNAEIGSVNFSGMRLLGRLYIDWRKSNVKELIYKQNSSNKNKEEQFRVLKENYNVTGEYSYEDEAYVEFKRTEAKAILENDIIKNPNRKVIAYTKYYFAWFVFDKMGKYATDPLRVLGTMFITYLIFTFMYIILAEFGNIHIVSSLFEQNDPKVLRPIGKAFYHSAITFLTIGYGDYYPDGISRWISAVEGFVGLFLMSYFTVAFVRKVLR